MDRDYRLHVSMERIQVLEGELSFLSEAEAEELLAGPPSEIVERLMQDGAAWEEGVASVIDYEELGR